MTVSVNHNYPHAGDLTVVDAKGVPIAGVEIRIFELEKFLAGETGTWVADTFTDSMGEWVDSIDLADGHTWVVHFQKLEEVGPLNLMERGWSPSTRHHPTKAQEVRA